MKHTLTDGPLAGKTFLVPLGVDEIGHREDGRYYRVDGSFVWRPFGEAVVDISVDTTALEDAFAAAVGVEPSALARLVAQASAGARVMIVAATRKEAAELFHAEVVGLAEKFGDVERISRANGAERIKFHSGGLVVPTGLNAKAGRGIAVDVLALIGLHESDARLDDLRPALATSKLGTVVVLEPLRVEADAEAAE